jgi:hypothetical protein
MKKKLLLAFLLFGFLGFAQQTKKKTYKKPVKKSTTVKKKTTVKKPIAVVEAESKLEEVKPIAEEKKEVVAEVVQQPLAQEVVKEDYEITAERVLKKGGWIKNRNSALVRGIEGFVKGVYVGNGKLYVLLEIANRTNINYDVESVSFITSPIQTGRRQLETEEKIFVPIWSNQPENFSKKSSKKLVYVFEKFNISDNKTMLFIMNEIDGERTLTLEIKPKYIINADAIR